MRDEREMTQRTYGQMESQIYPMKWFKFVIYFQLFFNMVICAVDAYLYLTGAVYEGSAAMVYQYYGNGLKGCDIAMGICDIALVVFALYARMALAKFKKNGPAIYMAFLAASAVEIVLYNILVCVVTGQWDLFTPSSLAGSVVGTILAINLNKTYFEKRKSLFIN